MNIKLKRLLSVFIDIYILSFPNILISLIFKVELIYFMYILICTKDLWFKNQSIGKKILKIEILRKGKKPNFLILLIRGMCIFLWPIEIFLIMFFNKSIGDFIFDTEVVNVDSQ